MPRTILMLLAISGLSALFALMVPADARQPATAATSPGAWALGPSAHGALSVHSEERGPCLVTTQTRIHPINGQRITALSVNCD